LEIENMRERAWEKRKRKNRILEPGGGFFSLRSFEGEKVVKRRDSSSREVLLQELMTGY
jgi:hypothetical protein